MRIKFAAIFPTPAVRHIMAVLLLLITAKLTAASPQLVIHIKGIQARPGQLKLVLYQDQASWMQADKALQRMALGEIQGEQHTLSLSLSLGEYAVSVMHDENNNDRMDMRWFPYPHPGEGVGVSNDAEGNMGPPEYEAARFDFVRDGQTITIHMRYYD